VLCTLPSRAHAATAPTYTPERLTNCGGWRGGGQRDTAGNLYLPCRTDAVLQRASIRIYGPDGTLTRTVAVPNIPDNGGELSDVAPSPDGRYLYVATYNTKRYFRLVRQVDGTYAYDADFRFQQFAYGTKRDPRGEFIATDAQGEVYIANGTWVGGAPIVMLHYAADGTFLGRFGDFNGGSRALGDFYWMLGDLTPTSDGMSVYTTEVGNNRVQRWDRNFDGSFTATVAYGNTAADDGKDDPNQVGDQSRTSICDQPGKFGAPYSNALDTTGNLYVMSTNCWLGGTTQVQRLDVATGTWSIINGPKYGDNQSHEIAIDGHGDIFMASVDTLLRATGTAPAPVTPPQPAVDVTAPQLSSVTLPATTAVRAVTLAITATDAVGVTQLRIAQGADDINAAAWVQHTAQLSVELTAGDGPKTIRVQVRDAAGNLSAVLAATTIYTAPVVAPPVVVPPVVVPPVVVPQVKVNQAPVLTEVTLPNPATTQAITVAIDATDDTAVTEMRLASEQGVWGPWTKFDAAATFTLTAGNGARGVFVQVRDTERLESKSLYRITTAAVPAVVVVVPPVVIPPVVVPPVVVPPVVAPPVRDTTAPVLVELAFPKTTTTRTITVATRATDDVGVTKMRLASDNGIWQPWQDYAAATPWTLAPVAMVKGVFVQVRDTAGNESNVKYLTTLCTPCLPAPEARAAAKVPLSLATRRLLRTGSTRSDAIRPSALGQDFNLSQDDHRRDVLDCGAGFDTALVRPGDVTRHCERVVVVRAPPPTASTSVSATLATR
ncbi:MAG: hypothetical protein H7287_06355, partial [Thermoleophilia bacterium]|nr:hypothetical protein [Thermoleophilia bacterium]